MLSHRIDFRAGYYVNLGVAVFPKPVHKQYINRVELWGVSLSNGRNTQT